MGALSGMVARGQIKDINRPENHGTIITAERVCALAPKEGFAICGGWGEVRE